MSSVWPQNPRDASLVVDALLVKSYPNCPVLRGAKLAVRRGTVHALVGENGAGKSTLVKILAGVLRADAGSVYIGGTQRPLDAWTRSAARAAGVGIVQQHGAFAETLSVVENAVLGAEGGPLLALDAPAAALAKLGAELGLAIDPYAIAGSLSVGAAQRAEIVAALVDVWRAAERGTSVGATPGASANPTAKDISPALEPSSNAVRTARTSAPEIAGSSHRSAHDERAQLPDVLTPLEPGSNDGDMSPSGPAATSGTSGTSTSGTSSSGTSSSGTSSSGTSSSGTSSKPPGATSPLVSPLLILDEPTAVLTPIEVAGLLTIMRALADRGITVLFVTHKLDEVREVADDVTVLREGETVATFSTREAPLDTGAIARAMVGADLPPPQSVPAPSEGAKRMLELRGVTAVGLDDIGLVVRAGEIVGVAGIDGNGQRELARAIAGLVPIARGTIEIAGKSITRASPSARLAAGLAHVHEDRHHGGLLLDSSVAENLALGRRDITGRFRIDRARVDAFARERIAELDIRPADPAAMVRALSGGNQQKIVVARELSRPAIACVVASQPTRGVDLGAVARIHERLRDAARGGAGVLVISADLDELLAVCHRIVVMLRGRIVGERAGGALHVAGARAALGTLMTGAATVPTTSVPTTSVPATSAAVSSDGSTSGGSTSAATTSAIARDPKGRP